MGVASAPTRWSTSRNSFREADLGEYRLAEGLLTRRRHTEGNIVSAHPNELLDRQVVMERRFSGKIGSEFGTENWSMCYIVAHGNRCARTS